MIIRLQPRIFVPRASEIPLFHAVVTADASLLDELLEQLTPEDVLSIRDSEERSLYHYAALSSSKNIRARVFGFVSRFFEQCLDQEISHVMAKTQHMHAYVVDPRTARDFMTLKTHCLSFALPWLLCRWLEKSQATKSTWIPPRVTELQWQVIAAKNTALLQMCECVDRNERSLFHYVSLVYCLVVMLPSRLSFLG